MIHVYISHVMVGKFLSGKLKFMYWFVFAALTGIATSLCFWILEFAAFNQLRIREIRKIRSAWEK